MMNNEVVAKDFFVKIRRLRIVGWWVGGWGWIRKNEVN